MEERLERAEALLRITAPHLNLNDSGLRTTSPEQTSAKSSRGSLPEAAKTAPGPAPHENGTVEDADESLIETMTENFGSLDIDDQGFWDYRGFSSGTLFMQRLQHQLGDLVTPDRKSVV